MHAMLLAVAAQADAGLSLAKVMSQVPHDAPALVIYTLTLGAVGWIVWANRKRPSPPTR